MPRQVPCWTWPEQSAELCEALLPHEHGSIMHASQVQSMRRVSHVLAVDEHPAQEVGAHRGYDAAHPVPVVTGAHRQRVQHVCTAQIDRPVST